MLLIALPAQANAGFGFQQVIERARELAAKPYAAPAPIPKFMQELSYDNYQNIRFDPQQSLWRENKSNFQIMLVPPGLYYTHAVKLNVIDSTGTHRLPFDKSRFNFTDPDIQKRIPGDVGYAGFKLTYPLRGENEVNQFLVFAGASYFRGVGRDNNFGISARGIAVNTGLSSGEKFPSFVEYWLVRPSPKAEEMVIYGLLDGEYLAGAYQFLVRPGKNTRLDVKTVLFPRNPIELLGVAPLTSMFFYGENTARPAGDWRPQVHDSDGLLINNGVSDEWIWRPLINPKKLEMDYFQTENVRGFGLLQRNNEFRNFEDIEAMYHNRPSTWVKPEGDWGKGEVVLVQLPSPLETNDNIVAFWHPKAQAEKNDGYHFSYSLDFGKANDIVNYNLARAVNTFVGHGDRIGGGNVAGAYRLIVDFAGGELGKLPGNTAIAGRVSAQNGSELVEQFVEYNAPCKCWRLSILAKPAPGKSLSLRAHLAREDKVMTETWDYRLPPDNDLLTGGR